MLFLSAAVPLLFVSLFILNEAEAGGSDYSSALVPQALSIRRNHHHRQRRELRNSWTLRRKFCIPNNDDGLETRTVFFFQAWFLQRRYANRIFEGACQESNCASFCNAIPCQVKSFTFNGDLEQCLCSSAAVPFPCGANAECSEETNQCICQSGFAGNPDEACGTPEPLNDNAELRAAVVDYLGNNTFAAIRYGPRIGDWNVSLVTDFSNVFSGQDNLNEPLEKWDVSRATSMNNMFASASSFSQDLSTWQVGNVADMGSMFFNAVKFVSDLSKWDVSKVTDMSNMFFGASNFTASLTAWKVDHVVDMSYMFVEASRFNSDIATWNVSSVTSMTAMFSSATSFNQPLCLWGSKFSVTTTQQLPVDDSFLNMFSNSGCPEKADPDFTLVPPGPFCYRCS